MGNAISGLVNLSMWSIGIVAIFTSLFNAYILLTLYTFLTHRKFIPIRSQLAPLFSIAVLFYVMQLAGAYVMKMRLPPGS